MSSLGNQWRVIRHYLSLTNLNAEMEKWVQKVKPVTPEQWDNLIKKFENAISTRLKETQQSVSQNVLKATTVEGTEVETKGTTKEKTEKSEDKIDPEGHAVGSDLSFESLMQGLKLKKDLHFGKISEPSWKSNKPIVTKTSIHSRTAYVISALVTATSEDSLKSRAEHFIDHLHQYPEARDYAIKEGAVRALLRVQHRLRADTDSVRELRGIINEALALVGHAGAVRGRGPRLLALDGGGVRGLVALALLRRLEALAGQPVHQLFDYVVGVSTGAIIAALIGSGTGNLETANEMYLTLSKQMFGNTSLIGGASRLVWSHAYYDTAAWERLLQDSLGDCLLSHCNRRDVPKMALVSCAVAAGEGGGGGARAAPFVFRTYECGFRRRSWFAGSSRARLWQAVRASAAAPAYFLEYRLGGRLHQDGGLVANNPAAVGLHEARLLFGAAAMRRATLVSVGTGRAPLPASRPAATAAAGASSWRDKFNYILDSATDTEGVHQLLHDLLPAGAYYRFNPPLLAACAMDETDDTRLQALVRDAHDYCHRNHHKLAQAAQRLTQKRTLGQRVTDYVQHRALLLGATSPH